MSSRLIEIFEDEKLVGKIKRRLSYMFQLAELERWRVKPKWRPGGAVVRIPICST